MTTDDTAQASAFRRNVARGWIDYSTLCIAFAWIGLWLLWPTPPVVDSERIPRRRSLVVARDAAIGLSEGYRRPDLIALPSLVSFSPMVDDGNGAAGVLYSGGGPSRLLARSSEVDSAMGSPSAVALAAEAAREISRARVPRLHGPWRGWECEPSSPVAVTVSAGLGRATPRWSATDEAVLFTLGRAWEVELSLTITDDGRPEHVFLERGSGDAAIDRAVLRTLLRPDVWEGATAGSGTVLVSFAPRTANGALN